MIPDQELPIFVSQQTNFQTVTKEACLNGTCNIVFYMRVAVFRAKTKLQ